MSLVLCMLLPAGSALAADPEDRIVLSGSVPVDRDETVQDLVVLDGDVTIRGRVRGDVIVGDVAIRGTVRGDVVTFAGTAMLGRRARVGGDLVYVQEKPEVTRGAVLLRRHEDVRRRRDRRSRRRAGVRLDPRAAVRTGCCSRSSRCMRSAT